MSVAVDANTGKAYKDADGKYVAKNVEFTTGAVKKGTVFPETTASVTFTGVNTSNVKSRKLVFYEYLVEGSVTKTVEGYYTIDNEEVQQYSSGGKVVKVSDAIMQAFNDSLHCMRRF